MSVDLRPRRHLALPITAILVASMFVASPAPALAGPDDENFEVVDHANFHSALPLTPPDTSEPTPSSGTGTGAPPRAGKNVQVNAPQQAFPNGLLGRSETTVAATEDGQFVVVGFNDAQGFCGAPFGSACTPQSPPGLSGYGFSSDGGATFTDGGAPPVINHVFTRGDPWLARGGTLGTTFYYANLAVHDQTGATLGVSVHRGAFSGSSFSWSDVRTFNSPNPNDFYDKEAIAARPGTGDAYVTVTNFQELCGMPENGFGQIEVWRTHDGGDTWQGPAIAGPESADSLAACGNTGTLQQSSVPFIGPNGELYVVWSKGPTFLATSTTTDIHIMFARSIDGGVTFSAPFEVASGNSMRFDTPNGYNRDRFNDHPRVGVATTGPNKGRVYVAYYSALAPTTSAARTPCPPPNVGSSCRGQRLTSTQIFVKHSDDLGLTWSTAVPIAAAPPDTGLKRFWPSVSVQPSGNLDVVYYESQEVPVSSGAVCNVRVGTTATGAPLRRRGSAHSLVDTIWARSLDGGVTFETPIVLSTVTTDWCTTASNIRPNFGDYIGSTSGGNRVLATWADGRNGIPDTFFGTGLGAGRAR